MSLMLLMLLECVEELCVVLMQQECKFSQLR
jgi:hypothetical protein